MSTRSGNREVMDDMLPVGRSDRWYSIIGAERRSEAIRVAHQSCQVRGKARVSAAVSRLFGPHIKFKAVVAGRWERHARGDLPPWTRIVEAAVEIQIEVAVGRRASKRASPHGMTAIPPKKLGACFYHRPAR